MDLVLESRGKFCEFAKNGVECHQKDFLPYVCHDGCKRTFCQEHASMASHECPHRAAFEQGRIVPECPLCGQTVLLHGAADTLDAAVSRHIENGCPKEDSTVHKARTHVCSLSGCKNKEMVQVTCKLCFKPFCFSHRLEADHACVAVAARDEGVKASQAGHKRPPADPQDSAVERRKQELAAKTGLSAEAEMRRRNVQAIMSRMQGGGGAGSAGLPQQQQQQQPAPVAQPVGAGAPMTAAKMLPLALLKAKAQGNPKVPVSQRVFFNVVIRPPNSPAEPIVKPMFFDSAATVGKVLDIITDSSGIVNENNKPGAKKLALFTAASAENWTPLPSNVALELLMGRDLASGGTLILQQVTA
jgi:hypothetical protein